MSRLLLPTRNRPTSLRSVLQYLERFYPGTELLIADGSSEHHQAQNQQTVRSLNGLTIDYRTYPSELPLFDRLVDVISGETDEYFTLASDDDYPIIETLARAEALLDENPEASTAMGTLVNLDLVSDDGLFAWVNPARPITATSAIERVRTYARWPVSTSFAVTRRTCLLERYERASRLYEVNWGSFDFWLGILDATQGQLIAVPSIGYICTRNHGHAYWRSEDTLGFLRHADLVLQVKDAFRDDFVERGGLDLQHAEKLSLSLIRKRIAAIVGHPPQDAPGFQASSAFNKRRVQRQLRRFQDLFDPGTETRQIYAERLAFIADALQASARSEDNAGEGSVYERVDRSADTTAADRQRQSEVTRHRVRKLERRDDEHDGPMDRNRPRELQRIRLDPTTLLRIDPTPTVHVLVLGQSNVASHGEHPADSECGHLFHEGRLMPLSDPLTGGSGEGGSVWTRVAPKLRSGGVCDDVVISMFAEGGSSIADWSPGQPCLRKLRQALPHFESSATAITHIVFHQGERDNLLGTGAAEYRQSFMSMYQRVSKFFPEARWILCIASWSDGVTSDAVREAQLSALEREPTIFRGPDTDLLGDDCRYDGTHFNELGLERFATMLTETIALTLKPVPAATSASA